MIRTTSYIIDTKENSRLSDLQSKFNTRGYNMFIDLLMAKGELSEDEVLVEFLKNRFSGYNKMNDDIDIIYIFFCLYKKFTRNSKISMRLLYELFRVRIDNKYILNEIKEYLSGLDYYNEIEYLFLCLKFDKSDSSVHQSIIKKLEIQRYNSLPSILTDEDYNKILIHDNYINYDNLCIFLIKFAKLGLQAKYDILANMINKKSPNLFRLSINNAISELYFISGNSNTGNSNTDNSVVLKTDCPNYLNKHFYCYSDINLDLLVIILKIKSIRKNLFDYMNRYIMIPEMSKIEKLSNLLKFRSISLINYDGLHLEDIDTVIGILVFDRLLDDPRRGQSVEDILLSLV